VAIRIAEQGERCVILSAGQEYAEIIERTEDGVLTLLRPDGEQKRGLESEFTGWTAVLAWKVIKGSGETIYLADGHKHVKNPTGRQVYSRGGVFV
jgi:hypothetical protein